MKKYLTKKIILSILLATCLIAGGFAFVDSVWAGDANNMLWGGAEGNFQAATGLGNTDPRIIAGNIIRIALGFLGIIAVVFILYGGWLYMTSEGDSQQIDKAKKVIISAFIGLVIMLLSFGVATFIMNRFYDATGATGGGGGGTGTIPITPPVGSTSCDNNTMNNTPTFTCDASNLICDGSYPPGTYFCDVDAGCTCQPLGGLGDPCDDDELSATCEANDDLCQADLRCEDDIASTEVCTCVGAPIIDWLSPVGGFCRDAANNPTNDFCRTDADCTAIDPAYTCDTAVPNGAPGNFITIGGRFFGTTPGQVLFWNGSDFSIPALFPDTANSNCDNNWQDNQVIVVVPAGAVANGPIRIERNDGDTDATNDARGPALNDFLINTIERPGLCLAENTEAGSTNLGMDQGFFDESFNLQGILLNGAVRDVRFGNALDSVRANNVTNWTNTAVDATVPNIIAGNKTVFTEIDNKTSNYIIFDVVFDYNNQPVIDYIDEASGPTGQYVTIYGSGFQNYVSGTSRVSFNNATFGDFTADGLNFPDECRDYWWTPRYIIVEVPRGITNFGDYNVTVTNSVSNTSEPEAFAVTSGTPGPGICLLDPRNGPINQVVNVYGANFGNVQGSGFIRFYNNVVAGTYPNWTNQLAGVNVPTSAQTGNVELSNGTLDSNSLPFMVGYCSNASECLPSEECCGAGTYWSGICRPTGDCSTGGPTTTGYGWSFSTSPGPAVPPPVCGGYSGAAACADAGACPNSLGQCLSRSNIVTGVCSDDYCNSNFPLCASNCVYDSANNLCRAANAPLATVCDQTSSAILSGYTAECRSVRNQYSGQRVWQTSGLPCPSGTFPDTNGWCTVGIPGTPMICDSCDVGFACFSGQCYINSLICPSGSSCDLISENCIKNNEICECCCHVGLGGNDCCYGLTCEAGGCGNDPINYGLCTGCRVDLNSNLTDVTAEEQAASNLACNCQGVYGKYCEILNPSDPNDLGACRDATPCDSDLFNAVCDMDQDMCPSRQFCDTDCFCKPASPCDDNNNPGDGCTVPVNCNPLNQYCDLADCFCKPRRICDNNDNTGDGCGAQANCDFDTEYCDDNCICQPQISCNGDDDLLVCERSDRCLAIGLICDPNDCLCKPDPGPPASPCVSVFPGCSTGFSGCESSYDCIDNAGADCRCCCDPANDQCDDPLVCWPNRGDCTGASRGLCCGCSSDVQCGGGANGCGKDTCCYARPDVISTTPANTNPDTTGICRNPAISVEFNQPMDKNSFIGNVIVVGDYGVGGTCPQGTQYLALNGEKEPKMNIFTRAFYKVIKIFKPILSSRIVSAYTSASLTRNYCAVTGATGGYDNAGGNSVLTFKLNGVLDANRRYYVIVKGDPILVDSQSAGVLNIWGVGMSGNADISSAYTFNGINFANSFVWSFETGADICALSHIIVNPASYLFQAAGASQSFAATPMSVQGQVINAIPEYNWVWNWTSDNTRVAAVTTNNNPVQTVTSANIEDGRTYINAQATIITDNVINPSTVGRTVRGRAQVFVMVCENPWPPVPASGIWYPWRDNNEGMPPSCPTCGQTNYEIYYCRDAGGVGTYDDLPGIVSDDTIILGPSLKCTDSAWLGVCSVFSAACGTGTCGYDIYKEAYFLREEIPGNDTSLTAVSLPSGEGATVSWPIVSGVSGYKLYWGQNTGEYSNYPLIRSNGFTPASSGVDCSVAGSNMTCDVSGLTAKLTYYFNLTTIAAAESEPVGEVSVLISDTVPPPAPFVLSALHGDGEITLNWITSPGAAQYVVYFTNEPAKAAIPEYPFYSDPVEANTLTIPSLTNGQTYYLAVTAIDSSGNESGYSTQLTAVPAAPSCGDDFCNPGECEANCALDCSLAYCCGREGCNDGIGETNITCMADCSGAPMADPTPGGCGDTVCDPGECTSGCVADCDRTDCCGREGCNGGLIGENDGNCADCVGGAPIPGDPPDPPIPGGP